MRSERRGFLYCCGFAKRVSTESSANGFQLAAIVPSDSDNWIQRNDEGEETRNRYGDSKEGDDAYNNTDTISNSNKHTYTHT